MLLYDARLKPLARRLRKGMTDAELRLWFHLRRKQIGGVQCYRQKPIGRYVVDFYLPKARLVVEVDGSQHFTAAGLAADTVRTGYLESVGLHVVRFDNLQILQETDAVLEVIRLAINSRC